MKLTETEWQAIKSSYESSTRKGFEQFAIKFGVARTTIARRAKAENWCKKRTVCAKKDTRKSTGDNKESIDENIADLPVILGKYKAEYNETAYNLSLAGFTLEQIAITINVSLKTITNWRKQHQDFNDAIIRGYEHSDGEVARSLFDVAVGNRVLIEEKEVLNQVTGELVTLTTKKTIAPNVKAIIHWMLNREKLKDYWSNGEGKNNDLTLEIDAKEVIDAFNEAMEKAREKYSGVMEKRQLQLGITIDADTGLMLDDDI